VNDALAYGPGSPQASTEANTSEDCLFLNVWTPALRDGGKRPVMFTFTAAPIRTAPARARSMTASISAGAATSWW